MAIIYEGKTTDNLQDMVVLTTQGSANDKTGNMLQVWYLLKNDKPHESFKEAYKSTKYKPHQSICGGCPHLFDGSCYVLWGQAPRSTWARYQRGGHEGDKINCTLGVRLGAAGNPSSAPFEVSKNLVDTAKAHGAKWTGYVHDWLTCDQRFAAITMASVESETEAEAAHKLGWRTFRTRPVGAPLMPGEIQCPAAGDDADPFMTCSRCGLCNGSGNGPKANISVEVHGARRSKLEY